MLTTNLLDLKAMAGPGGAHDELAQQAAGSHTQGFCSVGRLTVGQRVRTRVTAGGRGRKGQQREYRSKRMGERIVKRILSSGRAF